MNATGPREETTQGSEPEIAKIADEREYFEFRYRNAEHRIAKLREALLLAQSRELRWKPIAEIHEDFCPCIIWNVGVPEDFQLISNIDDWDELATEAEGYDLYTHFLSLTAVFHEGFDAAVDAAIAATRQKEAK